MDRPLADAIRPKSLEDVVGQEHLLGKNGLLRRIIESGTATNMIFYGPPGVGKTTLANLIAAKTNKQLYKLNATTASISDIKEILANVGTILAPGGILLYLDEIQYFNKKQQQTLLEFMENGSVTLIASTTENPYFYVYSALLSRSTVFEFKPVAPQALCPALRRAVNVMAQGLQIKIECSDAVLEKIAFSCGGDVRKGISAVELLCKAGVPKAGALTISEEEVEQVAQRSAMRYDRDGDDHYDLLSALQKSIRGSDPDAAIYYLARLLEAGDLLSPCRRLLVIAAEDVGLAYPQAISIVKACVDAAQQIGLPEARLPLAEAVILLATAPKSNSAHNAIIAAMSDVRRGVSGDIPRHLKNVHADSTGADRGPGYRYPHDFPNHYVPQQYFPDDLVGTQYYEYGENKNEQAAKKYWENIKRMR